MTHSVSMHHRTKGYLHRATFIVCSALCLPWAAGCGDSESPAPILEAPLSEPLYFEPIGRGQSASFDDTLQVVVRDSLDWQALKQQLVPIQSFRAVDFTQAMVVVIGLPAPSSGYGIEVESVEKLGDTLSVHYLLLRPAADCFVAPAETFPFQAVLVRRAEGEAAFEHRVEDLRCTFRQQQR